MISHRAFSLLEVLVSAAVLALLLGLLLSVVTSTSRTSRTAERRLDATSMARTVFERMAVDLATIVWDGDCTLIVGTGRADDTAARISDSFAFVCRARNIQTDYAISGGYPRLAAVCYNIGRHTNENLGFRDTNANDKPLALTRILRDVQWSQQPAEHAGLIDGNINFGFEDVAESSVSFRAIGEGIFRMAVVVHLKDGRLLPANSPDLPVLPSFTYPNASRMDSGVSVSLDLRKVSAITIGLAVLDMKSQILSVSSLDQIAQTLPRPAEGELPVASWEAISLSGIRQIDRENLRFFQRTFPIRFQ